MTNIPAKPTMEPVRSADSERLNISDDMVRRGYKGEPTMEPQEPKVIALTELSKIRGKFVSYEDYIELLARAEKAEAELAKVRDYRNIDANTSRAEAHFLTHKLEKDEAENSELNGTVMSQEGTIRFLAERAENAEALNAAKDIEIKANIQIMGVMEERISKLEAAAKAFIDAVEAIEPYVNSMIRLNFARTQQQYSGPNYSVEKSALRELLS